MYEIIVFSNISLQIGKDNTKKFASIEHTYLFYYIRLYVFHFIMEYTGDMPKKIVLKGFLFYLYSKYLTAFND